MDPLFFDYSDSISADDLPIDSHVFSPGPDQYPSLADGFFLDNPILDLESSDSAFLSNKVDPVTNLPSKSVDLDNGDLIFPSTMVSLDGGSFGPSMSSSRGQSPEGDSLSPALQNAEKSLYDVLGQQHLEESDQSPSQVDLSHYIESTASNLSGSSGAPRSQDATNVTFSSSDSADANILHTIGDHSRAVLKNPDQDFRSISLENVLATKYNSPKIVLQFLMKND